MEDQKIPYERLLKIARNMHTWIFLHTFNEQEAYAECGLTKEENAILGYGGQLVVTAPSEELDDMEAELDAAIQCIPHECCTCKHDSAEESEKCRGCFGENWEWKCAAKEGRDV